MKFSKILNKLRIFFLESFYATSVRCFQFTDCFSYIKHQNFEVNQKHSIYEIKRNNIVDNEGYDSN